MAPPSHVSSDQAGSLRWAKVEPKVSRPLSRSSVVKSVPRTASESPTVCNRPDSISSSIGVRRSSRQTSERPRRVPRRRQRALPRPRARRAPRPSLLRGRARADPSASVGLSGCANRYPCSAGPTLETAPRASSFWRAVRSVRASRPSSSLSSSRRLGRRSRDARRSVGRITQLAGDSRPELGRHSGSASPATLREKKALPAMQLRRDDSGQLAESATPPPLRLRIGAKAALALREGLLVGRAEEAGERRVGGQLSMPRSRGSSASSRVASARVGASRQRWMRCRPNSTAIV